VTQYTPIWDVLCPQLARASFARAQQEKKT